MFKSKSDVMDFAKKYSAIILLGALLLLNAFITPNFFKLNNLNNTITQICPIILCGMGMTLVISTAGIDISVGSVMAVAGVLTAQIMPSIGVVPAVLLAVAVSIVIGCFTGIMVGKLRLQAMVVTLGLQLGLSDILLPKNSALKKPKQ